MVVDEKETFAESNSNPSDDALQEAHPAEASEWTYVSIADNFAPNHPTNQLTGHLRF